MHGLIDIGANLTHDSFDSDRDEVVRRAREAGVAMMIVTGSSAQGSHDAVSLAKSQTDIFRATAGVHPHHAAEYDDNVHADLKELHANPLVVAVGECGLDYFRDFSPRDAQRHAFEQQIELAISSGLPIFLHQRDAHDDFVAMLGEVEGRLSGGVAHCFTGGTNELLEYVDMGLHIGVTGWICDERRGTDLYEAIQHVPLERLMIETDAPYLLPRTLDLKPKTRRNEPQYLPEVLRTVAEAMRRPVDEVAEATTANARRFFKL